MDDPRLIAFASALRQAGLRLTPQRLAICRTLAHDRSHPTAAELYDRLRAELPMLSLATVHTTLNALAALGLIHDLGDAGDGTTHYDACAKPHVNLICTRCHRIHDWAEEANELVALGQRVACRSGYLLAGARIAYYGLCPTCAQRAQCALEA